MSIIFYTIGVIVISPARLTGLGYLGLALFGMLGFLVVRPTFQIPGDTEATLDAIVAQPTMLQLGIVLELLVVISQAVAAVGFYLLFRADRPGAGFAVASFGMANAVLILGSAGLLVAALAVSGDQSLAPANDAASTVNLLFALSAIAWNVGGIFFGLWLIPMGWFAISTRRFPRVLGILLIVGGIGYILGSVVGAAVPTAPDALVNALPLPATVGELWMVGYLLVRGIRPVRALD